MVLKDTLSQFNESIEAHAVTGSNLVNHMKSAKNEDDLDNIKDQAAQWKLTVIDFLANSFTPEGESHASEFRASHNHFQIPGTKESFDAKKKRLAGDLNDKVNYLRYFKRMINIGDDVIQHEKVVLEKREEWDTDRILELLLDKLYSLQDGQYYPIISILELNGIQPREHGEERQFGKRLQDLGLVDIMMSRTPSAKLTLEGKIYIERKRKVHTENYDELPSDKAVVDARIDKIVEELNKLGLGHEILFDELQEIKEMYTKMNKKNWGQLIKGKMVDLAIGKLVENDTIKYIYEKITDHNLLLP